MVQSEPSIGTALLRRLHVVDWQLLTPFGLGLDVSGATLLAIGLLGNPLDLFRLAASYYNGNPRLYYERVQNRVRAWVAIPSLVLGFMAQAAGFVMSTEATSDPVGFAAASAAVASGIVFSLVCWRLARRRLTRVALTSTIEVDSNAAWFVAYACAEEWPAEFRLRFDAVAGDDGERQRQHEAIVEEALGVCIGK